MNKFKLVNLLQVDIVANYGHEVIEDVIWKLDQIGYSHVIIMWTNYVLQKQTDTKNNHWALQLSVGKGKINEGWRITNTRKQIQIGAKTIERGRSRGNVERVKHGETGKHCEF